MKKSKLIPSAISSLRIIALPLFIYLFNSANLIGSILLLIFCVATDFFDGFAARHLDVTSTFGYYYDAITDFIFTAGVYVYFTILGDYQIWFITLIAVAFAQFMITSYLAKKVYDPVGRYIGSALYIGITLTILYSTQFVFDFVQYAFMVFLAVSLISRIITLKRKKSKIETNNKTPESVQR